MTNWRPQQYRTIGQSEGVPVEVLDAAVGAGEAVLQVDPELPPIFTLKHVAYLTGTDYGLLRQIVQRSVDEPYRIFRIRKRSGKDKEKRFRVICAPDPTLLKVQRWIAQNVLNVARKKVHSASTAYAPGSSIADAARAHCGCRWLIKVDIKNFFESISEVSAYRAFLSLGYQPLISFELARLCTRLGTPTQRRKRRQWLRHPGARVYKIDAYVNGRLGHLPQGAPTSPMLANIVMHEVDSALTAMANGYRLTYTRYADDFTFSTTDVAFTRERASKAIGRIYQIIGKYGFSPNASKTRVVPPRARKVVLGLLVDGREPRLSREFKATMRMHIHYLKADGFGPSKHAARRGFSAVAGLRNHLFGLAAYATQIEPTYGSELLDDLSAVPWPS